LEHVRQHSCQHAAAAWRPVGPAVARNRTGHGPARAARAGGGVRRCRACAHPDGPGPGGHRDGVPDRMKTHAPPEAVAQLIAATANTLPEQVNALARARAFAEPLIAIETLDSGENTLAHADA